METKLKLNRCDDSLGMFSNLVIIQTNLTHSTYFQISYAVSHFVVNIQSLRAVQVLYYTCNEHTFKVQRDLTDAIAKLLKSKLGFHSKMEFAQVTRELAESILLHLLKV